MASFGCHDLQLGRRCDPDDRDGNQGGHHSWKDMLLGCHSSRTVTTSKDPAQPPRHRSRTPVSRRRDKGSRSQGAALRVTPPLPLRRPPSSSSSPPPPPLSPPAAIRQAQDPVADFFCNGDVLLLPPPRVDQGQLELEETITDALAVPLEFEEGPINALQLGGEVPP